MGSAGTGEFGNISDAKRYDVERCLLDIPEVELQDVANCDFYRYEGDVPPIFTAVYISNKLKNGRLRVLLSEDDNEIGLLPTHLSYLLLCMKNGHKYSGTILFSEDGIFPKIVVKLNGNY